MFSIRNSRVPIPNRIIRNLALSLSAAFTLACANVANPAKPAAENTPAPKADQGGEADKAKKTTAFDGERAFNHVKAQVEFGPRPRSEEHTSELQSLTNLVCRLLLEK